MIAIKNAVYERKFYLKYKKSIKFKDYSIDSSMSSNTSVEIIKNSSQYRPFFAQIIAAKFTIFYSLLHRVK